MKFQIPLKSGLYFNYRKTMSLTPYDSDLGCFNPLKSGLYFNKD